MTTRFHVEFAESVDHYGDAIVSGVPTSAGTFRGIFATDVDADFFETCMDADANVISYSAEILPSSL